jgi:tRNA threonylcarbamoyladenosine biosynthesis protein TsaB
VSDDVRVLAIDTASPLPAVALAHGGGRIEERLPEGRRASEELLPAISRCLDKGGASLSDLTRIALCAGPGSFTGLRVGLATAWGLSRAVGIPVETVSTLEAMAEAARGIGPGRVWAALDAGRGDAVFQLFSLDGDRARALGPAKLAPPDEVFAEARERGDPIVALPPALAGSRSARMALSPALALAVAAARAPNPAASSASFEPIYTRASAAEERRGAP